MLIKLNVFCRKIHRLLVFLVIGSGSVQLLTGLSMKYPKLIKIMSPVQTVTLHSANATIFSLIFFFMMLTGGYMFIFPYLQRWFGNHHPPTVNSPPQV